MQWNTVTKGYKTVVGSADMKLFGMGKYDYVSGGIQLFADVAGDLNFSTTSAGLSLAYLKSFDDRGRNIISLGFQSSFIQNSLDYSKIVAFDNIPGLYKGADSQISYWDVNAGLSWFSQPSKYNFYYVGIAASHLNNPVVSFLNKDNPDRANILYRKLTLHGGASIKVSTEFTLKPSFIFVDQGPHREINVGSFIRYKAKYGPRKKPVCFVYLGMWVRSYIEKDIAGIDAAVASIRFDYKTMYLTFSYDFNVSTYRAASQGRGGAELSIVKILDWDRKINRRPKVKCPIL